MSGHECQRRLLAWEDAGSHIADGHIAIEGAPLVGEQVALMVRSALKVV